jgi:hypothetical protein
VPNLGKNNVKPGKIRRAEKGQANQRAHAKKTLQYHAHGACQRQQKKACMQAKKRDAAGIDPRSGTRELGTNQLSSQILMFR